MAAYFKLWIISSLLVLTSSELQAKRPPSFERKIRAAPTPTIDLSLMPACVQGSCISPSAKPINCPTVPAPCPSGAKNTTCVTYPQDCYCKQTIPLACAWSCSWWNWLLAEDWFARPDVCASAPNITFDALPACAKDCIWQSSFDYGCITHTKNCFCTHGSLYGCDRKCKAVADNGPGGKVASWFAEQCSVTMEVANNALMGSSFEEARSPPWKKLKGHKLRWYEIMALTVAAATSVMLVAVWGLLNVEKAAKERNRPRRTMGTTSNQSSEVVFEKAPGDRGPAEEGPKNLKDKLKKIDKGLRSRIEQVIKEDPGGNQQRNTPEDGEK